MKVNINNKETETQALNVKQLAEELNLPAKGVAIAISNSMVPRNDWSRHLSQREQTSSSSRRFVEDDEIMYKL